jgi:hypothetical protein
MCIDQCVSFVLETRVRTRIRKLGFHGKNLYIDDEFIDHQRFPNRKAHIEALDNEDRKVND